MHAEVLTRFREALDRGGLPPGVTSCDPAAALQRFAVYRNNVVVGLSDALARRFPVIRRLVGDDFFRALARAYIDVDPPRSPVLSEWGAGFPGFLADFPPLARWPYLRDVARIEFGRGLAFHAADVPPLDPAKVATADPEVLTLKLHPSVIVLRLGHPAVTIWARHQLLARPALPASGPQIALILRLPSHDVPVEAIGSGDAALIEALAAGRSLAAAARAALLVQPDHDAQPRLVDLMGAGAFVETGGSRP